MFHRWVQKDKTRSWTMWGGVWRTLLQPTGTFVSVRIWQTELNQLQASPDQISTLCSFVWIPWWHSGQFLAPTQAGSEYKMTTSELGFLFGQFFFGRLKGVGSLSVSCGLTRLQVRSRLSFLPLTQVKESEPCWWAAKSTTIWRTKMSHLSLNWRKQRKATHLAVSEREANTKLT